MLLLNLFQVRFLENSHILSVASIKQCVYPFVCFVCSVRMNADITTNSGLMLMILSFFKVLLPLLLREYMLSIYPVAASRAKSNSVEIARCQKECLTIVRLVTDVCLQAVMCHFFIIKPPLELTGYQTDMLDRIYTNCHYVEPVYSCHLLLTVMLSSTKVSQQMCAH